MKWKLTHKDDRACIENANGKTLSYDPNLGIQIIERDGYAFKDLNNNGVLDPYEDWRLPLSVRVKDFTNRFALWQEDNCLYYSKGKVQMPDDFYFNFNRYQEEASFLSLLSNPLEDRNYLENNHIIVLLLLMFDNDCATGKEDYLLQLIVQSMHLGVLENIVYSIWEALKKFMKVNYNLQVESI